MKKCLVVVNTHKDESRALAAEIEAYLRARGVSVSVFDFDGFSYDASFEKVDFVVTLGGDGTVLFAARCCSRLGIPVFPVNLGEFGFIASIEKNDWKNPLEKFLGGSLGVSERSMAQACVRGGRGPDFSAVALNDIVVSTVSRGMTVVSFDVAYDGISLGTFKADGIIVSTATGSTAYSASAGGPIIDPDTDAFVLTPMNAFSLSSRPVVLNPLGEIKIKILPSRAKEIVVTVDGKKQVAVSENDVVTITRAPDKVRLVGCSSGKFYGALRSKLNWSGGPHA